jgi:hypothetical protein
MSHSKLSIFLVVGVLAFVASSAIAGTDGITNGGLDGSDAGWTWGLFGTNPGQVETGVYYGGDGNPPGCILLQDPGSTSYARGDCGYFQSFPVVPGHTYYLHGQWKGDIRGTNNPADACDRNWAEVHVAFSAAPITLADPLASVKFSKFAKKGPKGTPLNYGTGVWGWESILLSRDTAPDNTGAFTAGAGMNYMTVRFAIGGRANSVTIGAPLFGPGSSWYMVDNVHVCDATLAGDANIDCSVNFKDTAYIAGQWLTCGLDPATSCW